MKQYKEYKDSGITSVEKIPFNWKEKRLKDVTSIIVDGAHFTPTYVEEGVPFLRVTDVQTKEINFEKIKFIPTEEHLELCKRAKAEKGDLLLSKNGTIGLMKIVDWEWEFSFFVSLCLIRFQKDVNPHYFKYFFQSHAVDQQLKASSKTTSVTNLHLDKINLLRIAFPDRNEQSIIIKFLDDKIGKIDNLIANKTTQIQQLQEIRQIEINTAVTKGLHPDVPMRDSGIAWLGEIPEHWEVKRLKDIANFRSSNLDKKSKDGQKEVLLCNYVDVYKNDFISNDIKFMKATASDEEIIKFTLIKGDILVTKDSESPQDIAVPAYVNEVFENVLCGYHLAIIRTKSMFSEYLYRLFSCKDFNVQFEVKANGITRYGLGQKAFTDALVCIPSFEEQIEIANYLKKKTSQIDTLIENLENQIPCLQEIRKIEIYNAVTGKIRVS